MLPMRGGLAVAEALATGDAGALQGGPGWREM
jgi:hypothetical protein